MVGNESFDNGGLPALLQLRKTKASRDFKEAVYSTVGEPKLEGV